MTLCRIRVGTCRLRLRLPSFSCVLDMEASANVDAQGMGGSLDGPTFWLPSSGLFPPQRRDLSDSSRLGSTHNDRMDEMLVENVDYDLDSSILSGYEWCNG